MNTRRSRGGEASEDVEGSDALLPSGRLAFKELAKWSQHLST